MFSEVLKASDRRLTAEGDSLAWTDRRDLSKISGQKEVHVCILTLWCWFHPVISLSAVVFLCFAACVLRCCTDLISQLSFSALRDLIRMTVSQSPGKISPSLFFSPSLSLFTLSVTNSQWHLSSCHVSTESLVIHTSACTNPVPAPSQHFLHCLSI